MCLTMRFDGCVDVSTGSVDMTKGTGVMNAYDGLGIVDKVFKYLDEMSSIYTLKKCHNGNRHSTCIKVHCGFWKQGKWQYRQETFWLDFRDISNLKKSYAVLCTWCGCMKASIDEVYLHKLLDYLNSVILDV